MRFPILLLLAAVAASAAGAPVQGRLPVQRVSTTQGLVNDRITHIVTDSRGFLWFGTMDGVSRYDGQRFVNYTTADGLPHPFVTTVMESRDGTIFIATTRGLARHDVRATRERGLFTVIARGVAVNDVAQDSSGRIFAACDDGLCELRGNALARVTSYRGATIQVLVASRNGELWAGTQDGLMRRRANGTWEHYVVQPHRGTDMVHGLSIDPRGRLWISTGFGVFVAAPDELRSPLVDHVRFIRIAHDDAPFALCRSAVHTRDATWIPTTIGAIRVDDNGVQLLGERAGLIDDAMNAAGLDAAGNLWLGADLGGAFRIANNGITTFTRAQGLRHDRINSVFSLGDTLCATSNTTRYLDCFEGNTVRTHEIIPPAVKFQGWGWGDVVARDRNGDLWVATGEGVVRWNAGLTRVIDTYDKRDGLGGDDVFRIWMDSRGDLWFSTFGDRVITRREHATGKFIAYGESDGMPLVAPTAFAEDRAGNVWIGLYTGGVMKFDGKRFTRAEGDVPAGFVRDLHFDSRGTLWIAAHGGVGAIPPAPRKWPGSGGALSLAELRDGRMVIGLKRGADVFDVRTGATTRLTTADGLAQNEIIVANTDAEGALWLGTSSGLSRVTRIPDIPATSATPRPRIDSVDAGTAHVAIAELGTHAIDSLRLAYPDRRITVAFSAPDFDIRNPLQFEYRLTTDAQWTSAGTRRSVTYERLPFGDLRFEVRAIGANGRRSSAATISMNVIPPLWRRPWFLAIVIALVIAAVVLLHRLRVKHLLALQAMRMRVATDLHDDLGSSLSRISILSEVAKRGNERVLDEIGDTARGLIDALGDSIWSIDPRRDDLQSVLARVRHFAADVLDAKSISMDFEVPPSLAGLQLSPEKRRELFLILKEAINNAAKHSRASRLEVAVHADRGHLHMRIEDDGVGFDGATRNGGHGVPSMIARAERAGGTLTIDSTPHSGTRIEVSIPV